jgi:hypothetical protein
MVFQEEMGIDLKKEFSPQRRRVHSAAEPQPKYLNHRGHRDYRDIREKQSRTWITTDKQR